MSNLDSTPPLAAAAVELVTAEREPTAASVSALNGTLKRKRKKKMEKKKKMQEQQESPPDLDSTAAPETEKQGAMPPAAAGMDMGTEEQESTAASVSALNGTLKHKKKKMKKKNKIQQQQESPPYLDSMVAPEAEKLGATPPPAAAGVEMATDEGESSTTAVSALNGTLKHKNKKMKKKYKMQEQLELPPDLDSTAAPEAEKQVVMPLPAADGADMGTEEQESTAASVLALNVTLKHKKKKMKKENKMLEQQESPPDLDSTAASEVEKQEVAKGRWVEEREATDAAASEGTPKCNKEEEAKLKDTLMPEEEATATVVSAPEGTPKRKRKRKKKNKVQEELESPHASSGAIAVDKINANKSENCCADGAVASGHADVSMDPISGEDLSCAQSKENVADVLVEHKDGNKGNDNLSENGGLLQERSVGRKRQRRKRKSGSSSGGPGLASENGGMVAKHGIDSSTHHDLSCICASCLV